MNITKLIATATTAAVLGTAGVSIAGAATSSGGSNTPSTSTATAPANRAGRRALVKHFGKQALEIAAKAIGVKPAELVEALKGGKTIADVANEHNVQPQTVIDAIVQAADKKIDGSKLTDEQKAKLEQRVQTAAANFVNKPHPRAGNAAALRRDVVRDGVKLAADTIGIAPADLANELRSGKTIADVANEHNVQPQTVIDALVQAADKKIDASKLTDAQKAKLKEHVPTRIANLVNNGHKKA